MISLNTLVLLLHFFFFYVLPWLYRSCDCLFFWHKTGNFLLPCLPVCLLYSWSILKLYFFCLISQAAASRRPVGHAHGFASQRPQRIWLPKSESLSEWRPSSGKTLLFGTVACFRGFDPLWVVFTADEVTSRWDEDCVCLTETWYWLGVDRLSAWPIIGADIKHFTDYRYRPF